MERLVILKKDIGLIESIVMDAYDRRKGELIFSTKRGQLIHFLEQDGQCALVATGITQENIRGVFEYLETDYCLSFVCAKKINPADDVIFLFRIPTTEPRVQKAS